jgi:hypothetical protein
VFSFDSRDLYLDGNKLGCDGIIELLKLFADKAEMESIEKGQVISETAELAARTSLGLPVSSAMGSMSRPTSGVSVKSRAGSSRYYTLFLLNHNALCFGGYEIRRVRCPGMLMLLMPWIHVDS